MTQHFEDIGHDPAVRDITYENAQVRERTQILFDLANEQGGLVLGTGDLSEAALGWCTFGGDQLAGYNVNICIPKTVVRLIVERRAARGGEEEEFLRDVLATPVSPELLPAKDNGEIAQRTEDLVGPYELHDFYLYYVLRFGFGPAKIFRLARAAFAGREEYPDAVLYKWLRNFYWRFFAQQFKRSCLPDGPKIGSVTLSPRGDWRMPSDACAAAVKTDFEIIPEYIVPKHFGREYHADQYDDGSYDNGGKQLFDFFYADGFYYDGQNYVNKTCADKSYHNASHGLIPFRRT